VTAHMTYLTQPTHFTR